MIEPINGSTGIQEIKEVRPTKQRKVKRDRRDDLTISEEAKKTFQLKMYERIALEAPEIRPDKINLAQNRIKEGFYEREDIMEEIAKKILEEDRLVYGSILGLR